MDCIHSVIVAKDCWSELPTACNGHPLTSTKSVISLSKHLTICFTMNESDAATLIKEDIHLETRVVVLMTLM